MGIFFRSDVPDLKDPRLIVAEPAGILPLADVM